MDELGSNPSALLAEGAELGPFLLVRQIAVGGMAEIWSAREASESSENRGRPFALKILRDVFAPDQELRTMFLDEAKIAQRLRHPNILRVDGAYDFGGVLFQAMELLEGRDLRRILSACSKSGDTVPVPLALWIIRDVARALGYAHGARSKEGEPLQIIHRDVSPHNIMVTKDGETKMLDFGIARARERLTQTETGVIKGKISYMAPEQALARELSPRTDIYALGIVAWEILALRRLFAGSTDAATLSLLMKGEVPPIRSLNPRVPERIAELLARMLALEPEERPESMRLIEDEISRALFSDFDESDASQAALATWLLPLFELPRRKTEILAPDETEPVEATDTDVDTKASEVTPKDVGRALSDQDLLAKTTPYDSRRQQELAPTVALRIDGEEPNTQPDQEAPPEAEPRPETLVSGATEPDPAKGPPAMDPEALISGATELDPAKRPLSKKTEPLLPPTTRLVAKPAQPVGLPVEPLASSPTQAESNAPVVALVLGILVLLALLIFLSRTP